MMKDRIETVKEFRDDIASMQMALMDFMHEESQAYSHCTDKDSEKGQTLKWTANELDEITYDLEIIWQKLESIVNEYEEKSAC